MWYSKILFPIYYIYNFINFLFFIKNNSLQKPNYINLINQININLTILKLNNNYYYIITIFLTILINFCEIIPISFFFIFKYRQKHYIEICNIKFVINSYKYKILYKQISEIIIFLLKKIKYINLETFVFNFIYDIKYLFFYNKFDLTLNKKLLCFNTIILHKNYFFITFNLSILLKKLNYMFIEALRTNIY